MSIKNKIIASAFVTIVALAPALPAFAALERLREKFQSGRPHMMKERGENAQGRAEPRPATATATERRTSGQEKRQEAKQRLAEKRKQIIRTQFNRMITRFEAALERENKLGERIQSRIDKAKANGKDVTPAQAALDRAKAAWPEAKAALDEAKGKLETALDSEDPKTAFDQVRSLIKSAQGKIKAVHAAYVEAITALKGVGGGERKGQGRATSTP